jgi:hypothetical protein
MQGNEHAPPLSRCVLQILLRPPGIHIPDGLDFQSILPYSDLLFAFTT